MGGNVKKVAFAVGGALLAIYLINKIPAIKNLVGGA